MNTTKPVIKSPTASATKRYQHLRTKAESATSFESSTAALLTNNREYGDEQPAR